MCNGKPGNMVNVHLKEFAKLKKERDEGMKAQLGDLDP
jgi:hypothetical protein